MRRFILTALALTLGLTGVTAHAAEAKAPERQLATFAGGCFWCMEAPFVGLPGIELEHVTVGYIGGSKETATYKQVSAGGTGHAEAVQISYDPTKITYEKLLDVFWHQIDPTVKDAQFCDHGSQYRSGIFYHNEEQKKLAEESKKAWEKDGVFKKPIVTEITAASTFYAAEVYHQHYFKENPIRYNYYRSRCGRDDRLDAIWGPKRDGKH